VITSKFEEIFDYVTDDYARIVQQGGVVNNPCLYTLTELSQEGFPGTRHVVHTSDHKTYDQVGAVTERWLSSHPITPPGPSINSTFVERRAKLLALSNIDSSKYAFGEDLGELRETYEYLRNPIGAILHLSKLFRKLVKSKKKRLRLSHAKAIADVWLEYRFAFSPLLRSALNLIEAFSDKQGELPPRLTSHGKSSDEDQGSTTLDSSNAHFGYSWRTRLDGKASILYTVDNPVRDWRFTYGLRATDWPTTYWQLLPYSFMIDRLIDVSSFSKAIINLARPSVRILAASYTTRTDNVSKTQLTATDPGSGFTTTALSGNTRVNHDFTYQRVVWYPSVGDVLPPVDWEYPFSSASKIADMVTLILKNLR
jgi:hypothetical protein